MASKIKLRPKKRIIHTSLTTLADRLIVVIAYEGKVLDTVDFFPGEFDQAIADFFSVRSEMMKHLGHEEEASCTSHWQV